MMPDDRGWTKRDDIAGLLKAPAKIDIVAGFVVFGIETADIFESPPIKRHIATGDVLGNRVGEQDVTWSPGRRRNHRLERVARRWTHVGPADAAVIAAR